jgi:type VI secretion system protein ImpG
VSEELLSHYERELTHVRELAKQFAQLYPKIAGRLRIGDDQTQDPHVERLIQAFAFLTGRVRQKLDDEFPELTESLLGVLYPHYQAPVPSMGIIQFHLAAEQAESPLGYQVKAPALVETPPIEGTPCKFRSVYPVHLWPIVVESATLSRPPFKVPETPNWRKAGFLLELVLRHANPEANLADLKLSSLRFYLRGDPQHQNLLYELLFNHTIEIAVAAKPTALTHALLPATALKRVGFERDEGMLPYPARSHLGYRLLTEYFTFPGKFMFVDLTGLAGKITKEAGNRAHVFIYLEKDERLERATIDLEQYVKANTFRLGCSPAVNLYRMNVGPLKMDPTRYEYRLIPDPRNLKAHEIYTLDDRINATNDQEQERDYYPLFSTKHGRAEGAYWVASRRPAVPEEGEVDRGTDVYLSLVDLDQKREPATGWTLHVDATCLNRDLPARLPYGGDALPLTVEGAAGVSKVEAITGFTPTHRPAMRRGALWRLISHLSLNHLSLLDNGDQAEALREVLRLYEFTGDAQMARMIGGVVSVKGERVVARPAGAICRGVQITVVFDEANYAGHELFLFASVLERFFAGYCSLNSFTKMVAKIRGGRETLHEWEPRAGDRALV